ncbi:type VII secretion protein EccB [Streptomyces sp. NPDC004788]
MASRRDELNAYTFAKKRTVAAFLQPSPTGTEEGAPKPLRAVVPGLVIGALVIAGFGAWGMFRPTAPKGWDKPGTNVIIGKQSTTRYVVLTTGKGKDKKTLLHPVLNLASARLLLNPDDFHVVQVDDAELDKGKPPRGPILGIPYAPDRLPGDTDAGTAKRWAVCEQPGGGNGGSVQKATFLFAQRDTDRIENKSKLKPGQILYVQGQTGKTQYLVDDTGTKYRVNEQAKNLTTALFGVNREPQQVTDDWLATLKTGDPVDYPTIPGQVGADAGVNGGLTEKEDRVGMVLRVKTGSGSQQYVVLQGKVQPVSDFTAWLIINSPQTDGLDMAGEAPAVDLQSITPDPQEFGGGLKWPKAKSTQVNSVGGDAGSRDTICSVLESVDSKGRTTLSTWAGAQYPAEITAGGTSTYVTPGTGLLYTQFQGGRQARPDGSLFLVTDTGLRYAVQANGDSDKGRSEIGAPDQQQTDGRPEPSDAQKRLGYERVTPVLVPLEWSEFLSKGPRLDTNSARQPQGS